MLKFTYTNRPKEGSPLDAANAHVEETIKEHAWNEELVSDFVRRLGFLDADATVKDQFDRFLYSNQVS